MNLGSSGSSSFGSDLGSASSKNTDSIIQQTQMALQMQQVQNLLQGAGEKCIYPKCIPKPGKYLDRSESSCLTNCLDRYLDTFQLVAKTYANRIKQESGASTGGLSSFQ